MAATVIHRLTLDPMEFGFYCPSGFIEEAL
jgi:hypothetical protein